jgi:hypothetical protein
MHGCFIQQVYDRFYYMDCGYINSVYSPFYNKILHPDIYIFREVIQMITYMEYLHVKQYGKFLKKRVGDSWSVWRQRLRDHLIRDRKIPFSDLVKAAQQERKECNERRALHRINQIVVLNTSSFGTIKVREGQ